MPQEPSVKPHNVFGDYLLPGWQERLQEVAAAPGAAAAETGPILRRSPTYYGSSVQFVRDAAAGQAMVELVRQRPIACAGFDTEFKSTRPSVVMKVLGGKPLEWHDPKSIVPLLFSFAFLEPGPDGKGRLYRFVADVHYPAVLPHLQAVLDVPVPFCCHFAPAELHCLWQLGLREPRTIWDSWVAQRAQLLGRFHGRNKAQVLGADAGIAKTADQLQLEIINRCDLISVCRRHGIEHPFAGNKDQMQKSFMKHPKGLPFSQKQKEYSAADAAVAAWLYPEQISEALRTNALTHLQSVEMPWAVTNARMIYDGVYVCPDRLAKVKDACARNVQRLEAELREQGLENVNSHKQVKRFMASIGLLSCFGTGGNFSFDDKHLEAVEDRDPAIAKLRQCIRMLRMQSDRLFTGELIGADGRFHPIHRQFGAESTRNSMR